MSFDEIIAHAGRRSRLVKLKVMGKGKRGEGEIESLELEPYSAKQKNGALTFFCLHPETSLYLDIELSKILDAEMTERSFKPRFPVTF